MRAEPTTLSASKPKKKAKPKREVATREFGTVARPIRLFCQAVLDTGDVTRAYLESHPDCKTERQAKYRGRALLKRGDVRAHIAELKAKTVAGQGDSNPKKTALLEELNLIAYAGINLKKLHPKEKLTALRTIAEIEGWMKPKETGTGLRATFNFHVGNARRGAGRTVTVDMAPDTGEEAIAPNSAVSCNPIADCVVDRNADDHVGVGVAVDLDPETHNVDVDERSEATRHKVLRFTSESESESATLLTVSSPQSRSQLDDSKGSRCYAADEIDNGHALDHVSKANRSRNSLFALQNLDGQKSGIPPETGDGQHEVRCDATKGLRAKNEGRVGENGGLLSDGSALLTVGSAPLSAGSPQLRSQVVDSTVNRSESAEKAPNTSAPAASRSQATDRPGDPVPVDKSAKTLFDASNT